MQFIVGMNCDLRLEILDGRFCEDMLARIILWTFLWPWLPERREDLEPNVDYELERFESKGGRRVPSIVKREVGG